MEKMQTTSLCCCSMTKLPKFMVIGLVIKDLQAFCRKYISIGLKLCYFSCKYVIYIIYAPYYSYQPVYNMHDNLQIIRQMYWPNSTLVELDKVA